MIYLIGGPPKCGKTTLAKRLSKQENIPWVSTDTLQNVIKPYFNQKDLLKCFPASAQRGKSNDEKYSRYSIEEIISAYRHQAKSVYHAIDMFIVSEITDGNDFIVEGYHIEPDLVATLKSKYPDIVKEVFLVKRDEEKFVCDIKESATPNDWILVRTQNEEIYAKIAKMICEYGRWFETESQKHGFKAFNMDNNFDSQITDSIDHFLSDG